MIGAMKTTFSQFNLKLRNAMPRTLGLCLISALLLPAWSGCTNKADSNANLDPTGVYALVSVDGKNVPCDLIHEGATLTVKSGVFTITPDAHCRSLMTFSLPQHGDMSREVNATYTRRGAELTMQWEGAGMTLGNVHGNTFTMTNEDMVLAYRK